MRATRLILPLLFLTWSATAAFSQVTNLPSATAVTPNSALPEVSFSIMRLLGSLGVVVGLFLAGVWCFKNWQRLTVHRGRNPKLQVLEVKSLGGRHALYLVAYEQQRLLVASSPGGVSLITHLPEATDAAPIIAPTAFGQALDRIVAPQQH